MHSAEPHTAGGQIASVRSRHQPHLLPTSGTVGGLGRREMVSPHQLWGPLVDLVRTLSCSFFRSRRHPGRGPRLGAGLLHSAAAGAAAPGLRGLRPAGEKGMRCFFSLAPKAGQPEDTRLSYSLLRMQVSVLTAQGGRDTPPLRNVPTDSQGKGSLG